MNSGNIAVSVEGLRRTFGEFVAVDDIGFQVRRGEIFGFLGPNGAGKSTTIKMLCGLLIPTGGSGTVAGYDIMRQSEEIKRNIGYMSQRFSLYDDLTVEENINFFSGMYGVSGRKREERRGWVLEMAGLRGRRGEVTGNLPGGFKQRLALGCAIIHEPSIIFLDEPTSGVDPVSRRNFWELIYEMSQGGTTVFVTTHYMDEAEYCDRLALIYRGRIIARGTSAEMKKEHMKKNVLEIGVDGVIEGMEALSERGIDTAIFGSVLHLTVDDAEAAIPEVKRVLEEAGVGVKNIDTIMPSLEDVFVTLIEEA